MRRQCARPGCSAVATTTFTFDSREQTVFLDAPRDGAARAGELCARHARSLAAPRGWQIVDRRGDANTAEAATASDRTEAVAAPAVLRPTTPTPAPAAVSVAPAAQWHPRFERGDTLGGVLDAATPLLSRAFRNVRAG
jgi:hypothetical protein